ncbi:ABC transporter ATP-binding protein [Desulforegula conservatrix]|uniref:ABC transporter ATP-binding protein n=1 Tax=Desulforegula conservatrix TaxID=153026 RepID=UPI000400A92D|nr:ABC transporter ATP-binding protein [Desulforegula conservatrix]
MNKLNQKNNTQTKILEVRSVSKSFGGIKAQKDISFDIDKGTVAGLIGPNGAGKTTLFNLVTGVYTPDTGSIFFEGNEITGESPANLVKMGISRTFQNVALFESMTALENVMVGAHIRTSSGFLSSVIRASGFRKEEERTRALAYDMLDFVGLKDKAMDRAGDFPLGWQRLLEIARSLASSPSLILLDEPAAGLNAVETSKLGEIILRIKDQGITVLLVEHDMSLTMNISDKIVVLEQGRKLAEDTPREIQRNPEVMAAYLGTGD